jgi:Na+/citrate or Na+/malate symporter
VLIKGFLKIFVPLAAGLVAAAAVGTAVGTILGLGTHHTFFYIVVPIMAGGVGEGSIPLSVGFAALTGVPQGEVFAEILPAVMLGSLTAIQFAGVLNLVGKRYRHFSGEGRLQPGKEGELDLQAAGEDAGKEGDKDNGGGRRSRHDCGGRPHRHHALTARSHLLSPVRAAGAGRDAVLRGAD